MTKEQLSDELKSVFLDVINLHSENPIAPEQLTQDADFFVDLGVDSLLAVALVVEVQRTFKVRVPDDQVGQLRTLRAVCDYVWGKNFVGAMNE